MPLLAPVRLPPLVLGDDDLLAQALLQHLCLDLDAGNQGAAHLDIAAIIGEQQRIEAEFVARGSHELLHAQGFPFGDAVLFSSGLDDGVHRLLRASALIYGTFAPCQAFPLRMATDRPCPSSSSTPARATISSACRATAAASYSMKEVRLRKSPTPSGEAKRALPPVGRTWLGPA